VNIGATVIDRIHIGDNSVVGASALVTRDLPDNVVAFGTPANIVRDKPLENFNGISF
jgi:acetyltransferase-like isoleucine patch superfamily enzyme